MIVIIEGPDGSGKTQLARQLCEQYGLVYHHEGPTPMHTTPLAYYGRTLQHMLFRDMCIDRFALGERVYGPLHRGVDRLGPQGWRVFRKLMDAAAVFPIMCLPPYKVCHTNWSSGREEMIHDESVYYKTWRAFARFQRGMFVYDYTRKYDLRDLTDSIRYHTANRGALPAVYGQILERALSR